MKQGQLLLKSKKTYYSYVILEFLTEEASFLNAAPASFFMLESSTLLKKPISVMYVDEDNSTLFFFIKKVGRGTEFLYNLEPGDVIQAVGPSGNSFPLSEKEKYILVGGGSGIPPLHYISKTLNKDKYHLIYGGRNNQEIVPIIGGRIPHNIMTEDGSIGLKGNVVDGIGILLEKKPDFKNAVILSCGPVPMVKAIYDVFPDFKHFTSLESYMGCGFGVCLGCVVNTVKGFRRVCVDGPVFDVNELVWND